MEVVQHSAKAFQETFPLEPELAIFQDSPLRLRSKPYAHVSLLDMVIVAGRQ